MLTFIKSLFLSTLQMSITASYVIMLIIIARFLLKKMPKIYSYLLWSVAYFRLSCNVKFESIFSLIPSKTTTLLDKTPIIISQDTAVNSGDFSPIITAPISNNTTEITPIITELQATPIDIFTNIASVVWLLGIIFLSTKIIIKTISLSKSLENTNYLKSNIYTSKDIDTAFVFGIFKPKIYLQEDIENFDYILMHEKVHIQRWDNITRVLCYIITIIHWYNPLVWLAFILSSKDMEMSCDETVLKVLSLEEKKIYLSQLLTFSTTNKITPHIAFSKGDVTERITNMLNYKKPKLILALISTLCVGTITAGCMTNAVSTDVEVPKDNTQVKTNIQTEIDTPLETDTQTESIYVSENGMEIQVVMNELLIEDSFQLTQEEIEAGEREWLARREVAIVSVEGAVPGKSLVEAGFNIPSEEELNIPSFGVFLVLENSVDTLLYGVDLTSEGLVAQVTGNCNLTEFSLPSMFFNTKIEKEEDKVILENDTYIQGPHLYFNSMVIQVFDNTDLDGYTGINGTKYNFSDLEEYIISKTNNHTIYNFAPIVYEKTLEEALLKTGLAEEHFHYAIAEYDNVISIIQDLEYVD